MDLLDDRLRKKSRFNIAQVDQQCQCNRLADLQLLETWSYDLTGTASGNVLHAGLAKGICVHHRRRWNIRYRYMAGRVRKSLLTAWNSVFERLHLPSCQNFTVPRGKESSFLHLQQPEAVRILDYARCSSFRITVTQIKQDILPHLEWDSNPRS